MFRLSCVTLVMFTLAPAAVFATPYNTAVQRDLPMFYWNFDEASGNAVDLAQRFGTPADNALAPLGGASRTAHSGLPLGNAADLSGGGGSRFAVGDVGGGAVNFVPSQLWALEFWIQPQGSNVGSRNDYLMESIGGGGGANNPGLLYDFSGHGDNKISLFRSGSVQGSTIDDDQWHHAVIAFYGNAGGFGLTNRQDFWLDGKLVESAASPTFSSGFALQQLAFGAAYGGSNEFQGRLDEIAIYDIGGTVSTVQAFEDRLGDLAAHYRLATGDSVEIAPQSYSYNAAGHLPNHPSGLDPSTTKLTDGIVGPGQFASGDWVGISDSGADDGIAQPLIDFDFGAPTRLDMVQIDYLVDLTSGVHAPDSVTLEFSNDPLFGSLLGSATNFGFINVDEVAGGNNGTVRSLTFEFPNLTAQYVRMALLSDAEWVFLGEVQFFAPVPEPSTFVLSGVAGLALAGYGWKRRRR